MFQKTDDLRIRQVRPLIPPAILHEEIPISERASNVVAAARAAITNALKGQDQRLVVIAGPCSIHDAGAALEYGERLARLASRYADQLIVVMRAYFEKPRTSVGWKGLIRRSRSRRELPHQQGASPGAETAGRRQRSRAADGIRISRSADSAAHRRLDLMGGDSARVPPRARSIASSPRGCRCQSASRTAWTAA